MRLLPAILGALSFLTPFARAGANASPPPPPVTTDILYWPVGSPQPSLLARVAYDPTSLKSNVISYHAASADQRARDDLVRVGLYTSTPTNPKQWVGSLAALSSLNGDGHQPTFRLHLGPANEVYHVSLTTASSATKTATSGPIIELVSNDAGAKPRLNRPVVLGPDGQKTEEAAEKSFFQKYWWVFLIIAFLSLSGGGGGGGGEGQS